MQSYNDNTPSNNQDLDVEIIEEIENEEQDINSNESNEDREIKLQEDKENSKFKEGEKITMIRVRFPGNARSFPFLIGKRRFSYGQKVVAMSDRGMTVGYINSFPYEVEFNKSMLPIRSIAKVATDEDIKAQIEFRDSEKKAEVICLRLIEKYELEMVLTHVEFTQFGKKAVFYFNAPARVDFRDLVKDLVYELKMRIELRQISVRDRAAALGSVGACGLQTCCSSFLKNYGNVSIKMAKNQNLALIPSKLNGVCGQIKCCIRYEDDVYTDKRKNLPREGSFIRALNGDRGKVQKLNILVEQFEMLTDTGIRRRYSSNQYSSTQSDLGPDYRFPESFDNIVNETQSVIGITKEEQVKSDSFYEQNIKNDLKNSEETIESTLAQENEVSNQNENKLDNQNQSRNQNHQRQNRDNRHHHPRHEKNAQGQGHEGGQGQSSENNNQQQRRHHHQRPRHNRPQHGNQQGQKPQGGSTNKK
jgi:cell fate regulator YaaT (PSP1 superfamily)